ncbi:hypothetical protein OR1_00163 [Geobacter sp. OR-1]|uniref:hypothetical protein n=1 Tax=Geobacter sp. OR-1 TaxID=1266765 RepID=UPI000543BF19|nr:hypothetical protein [Geobacter sp. OR-1]GAM07894.1 hypothetical protein OR1_00163 [Geobacter sp. OR-1]
MNCFACDGEIKGGYKVIYCVPEHHTREELKESGGILGKLINRVGGPGKFDIKIEQGRHVGRLDRFIGVSPKTKQYTRWREVKKPKASKKGIFGSIFGADNVYACYLHVTCYAIYAVAKEEKLLTNNFFHGFTPPDEPDAGNLREV